ncbi:hypothetical protein J6590_022537 [Homalodisca vitripennis]|nr:hypothetical protein J6590_022537 [Homalodisca vitripennis]
MSGTKNVFRKQLIYFAVCCKLRLTSLSSLRGFVLYQPELPGLYFLFGDQWLSVPHGPGAGDQPGSSQKASGELSGPSRSGLTVTRRDDSSGVTWRRSLSLGAGDQAGSLQVATLSADLSAWPPIMAPVHPRLGFY